MYAAVSPIARSVIDWATEAEAVVNSREVEAAAAVALARAPAWAPPTSVDTTCPGRGAHPRIHGKVARASANAPAAAAAAVATVAAISGPGRLLLVWRLLLVRRLLLGQGTHPHIQGKATRAPTDALIIPSDV